MRIHMRIRTGSKPPYWETAWHALPLIGLLLWGALSLTDGLWYDEAYSAAMVSKSIPELVQITARDVHSPFYYVLAKGFYLLCGGGTNYRSLKWFSLLFSFGFLLLEKYGISRLYDRRISVYAMAVSILMPAMAVQTTNARMYACGLFFLTGTELLLLELYRRESPLKWFLLALCSICSVYCHIFQLIETFLLYLCFFGAVLYSRQYRKLKGFSLCGGFVALAYLPWLFVTLRQLQLRIEHTSGAAEAALGSETRFQFLITYGKEWFSAGETPYAAVMYLGMALFLILGYWGLDYLREHRDYGVGAGLLSVLGVVLLGTYLNLYVAFCFMGRYIFPAFGIPVLLCALGMSRLKRKSAKVLIWAALLYCFSVQYASELRLEYDSQLGEYREFVRENVKEGDAVMAEAYYLLMLSVYEPDLTYLVYGHLDEGMPFPVEFVFTDWEQLEAVPGTLWYIGLEPERLSDRYSYEPALQFHHMYYEIGVYKMTPLQPQPVSASALPSSRPGP